jgi:hypothetical protein
MLKSFIIEDTCNEKNGPMTLTIKTLSTMALSIMAISIMTSNITTLHKGPICDIQHMSCSTNEIRYTNVVP